MLPLARRLSLASCLLASLLGCATQHASGGGAVAHGGSGADVIELSAIEDTGQLTLERAAVVVETSGSSQGGPYPCSGPSGRSMLRPEAPSATLSVSEARKVFVASDAGLLLVDTSDHANKLCIAGYDGEGGSQEMELRPGRYALYPIGEDGTRVGLSVTFTTWRAPSRGPAGRSTSPPSR